MRTGACVASAQLKVGVEPKKPTPLGVGQVFVCDEDFTPCRIQASLTRHWVEMRTGACVASAQLKVGVEPKKPTPLGVGFFGAATQIRTGDLILTKDVLYQLSHSSKLSECHRLLPVTATIIANKNFFVNRVMTNFDANFKNIMNKMRHLLFVWGKYGKIESRICAFSFLSLVNVNAASAIVQVACGVVLGENFKACVFSPFCISRKLLRKRLWILWILPPSTRRSRGRA